MKYEFITNEFGDNSLIATDQNGKVWYIPQDPNNSMYQQYLESIKTK